VTDPTRVESAHHPVLLCYDGSEDAAAAITGSASLLSERQALVLTVWEPVALWEPYDPLTVLSAPLARLAANAFDLDEIVTDLAREKLARGLELATEAGWQVSGHLASGKPARVICDLASKVDAKVIVVGARGLGRAQTVLLGSVSSSVVHRSDRPVLVLPHTGRSTSPTAAERPAD
jgi:nucleotide-binding universal stress UspA family protein